MKKLLAAILTSVVLSTSAWAVECPRFTSEQRYLIDMAWTIGKQPDPKLRAAIDDHLGHTLAAVVWKESFIGSHVIRMNPNDPSFGVGHMQISTVMWLDGLDYTWENRGRYEQDYVVNLMSNDQYAISKSYQLLRHHAMAHNSIYMARLRYNGAGPAAREYAGDISDRVYTLMACGVLR